MKVQIRRRFALALVGASFATSLILGSASVGAAAAQQGGNAPTDTRSAETAHDARDNAFGIIGQAPSSDVTAVKIVVSGLPTIATSADLTGNRDSR